MFSNMSHILIYFKCMSQLQIYIYLNMSQIHTYIFLYVYMSHVFRPNCIFYFTQFYLQYGMLIEGNHQFLKEIMNLNVKRDRN